MQILGHGVLGFLGDGMLPSLPFSVSLSLCLTLSLSMSLSLSPPSLPPFPSLSFSPAPTRSPPWSCTVDRELKMIIGLSIFGACWKWRWVPVVLGHTLVYLIGIGFTWLMWHWYYQQPYTGQNHWVIWWLVFSSSLCYKCKHKGR